jgi:hypothetical protein
MRAMVELLGAVAAGIAIVTGGIKGGGWLLAKRRERKALAAKAGASGWPTDPPYPVRLKCREQTEFHPQSGYHEGLVFEVFNESDKAVTVKGFGLDITLHSQDEWHDYEQARHYPPYEFPLRREPHDGLDGFIDTEALVDEIHTRGDSDYVVEWRPYVDVAGYGKHTVDLEKGD